MERLRRQPHRPDFQIFNRPDSLVKVCDVVSLYVAVPERAIALCVVRSRSSYAACALSVGRDVSCLLFRFANQSESKNACRPFHRGVWSRSLLRASAGLALGIIRLRSSCVEGFNAGRPKPAARNESINVHRD